MHRAGQSGVGKPWHFSDITAMTTHDGSEDMRHGVGQGILNAQGRRLEALRDLGKSAVGSAPKLPCERCVQQKQQRRQVT